MKYVKYALIALAPVVLIVGLLFSMGGNADRPDKNQCMNILTGEVSTQNAHSQKGAYPFRDKEGNRVLYPAKVNEDGEMAVLDRYRKHIEYNFPDTELAIDRETLTIKDPG
jgi:hypothetical protein